MLELFEILLPAIAIVIIALPLVSVFRGKCDAKATKKKMITHVCMFFGVLLCTLLFQLNASSVYAAGESNALNEITGTIAQGLGFIAAALATGLSSLGAGIAVASAAPAAIGAFSENAKNFGKSMIFVVLGEGVAIYGLIISILIVIKL